MPLPSDELCFIFPFIFAIVRNAMDPLSDVLSLLRPHAYVSSGFDAGGDWAVQFADQHKLIKCYAVVSGDCWLTVDGVADPVHLVAGDCFVLPTGRAYKIRIENSPSGVDFIRPVEVQFGRVTTLNIGAPATATPEQGQGGSVP